MFPVVTAGEEAIRAPGATTNGRSLRLSPLADRESSRVMSVDLLLDGLLLLIVILFVPIGFWRGAVREACVGAAILLGAAAANAWSSYLGHRLGSVLGLSSATLSFVAAVTMIGLTTLVLGYGAGLAFDPGTPGLPGRFGGAIVAAGNGAMIVGFSLASVERDLLAQPGASSLDEGFVAGIFLRRFGWVLAGVGLIGLATVIGGTILRRFETRPALETLIEPQAMPWQPARPVRVPRDADAGKHEPPVTRLSGTRLQPATVAVTDQERRPTTALPWQPRAELREDRRTSSSAGQHERPVASAVVTRYPTGSGANELERTRLLPRPPASSPPLRRSTNVTPFPTAETGGNGPSPPAMATSDGRCQTCGFTLRPGETYCPDCGAAV